MPDHSSPLSNPPALEASASEPSEPLRLGVLGAARITPRAVVHPARQRNDIVIHAIAARDVQRAARFARRYKIPVVHQGYQALIDDPSVDAIYNPLPNSHHAQWTEAALRAGKHVLCEKPLAANAAEADHIAHVAQETGRILMEAFHYRYHPLIVRALTMVQHGLIGPLRRLSASMCLPVYRTWDIRYRYDLAGGATMDLGCYTIHLLRTFAQGEPTLHTAQATLRSPQIDRAMHATMHFPGDIHGAMTYSLWSHRLLQLSAEIQGELGRIRLINPFLPHYFNRLHITTPRGRYTETASKTSTYAHQLTAFVQAIRTNRSPLTGPDDAVANMRAIDDVYRIAGLSPRGYAI